LWITDPYLDPAQDPDLQFSLVAVKMPTENIFFLILTVGTFTSFFKDNLSLRSHKTAELNVFLHFFIVDG
jgi:hypothetical protein